jgi:hypothetical protein
LNYNPINAFHDSRRMLFATHEKYGYDKALEVLKNKRMPATSKAGLKAELIVYEKYGKKMKLEPLLDAGVKADFTGKIGNRLVNIDVTTNINYKDIDDYAEISQKRKKLYYIIQVNLKNEEIEFFPLRFPYCPICRKFAHYILYLVPSTSEINAISEISDDQRVIRYCPYCDEYEEKEDYNYLIRSFSPLQEELKSSDDIDDSPLYTARQIDKIIQKDCLSTTKFFEKQSKLLISALAENDYVITSKDGDGYSCGRLHWKHPLAKGLGSEIDMHFAPWADSFQV